MKTPPDNSSQLRHDLATPITTLLLSLELLKEKTLDAEQLKLVSRALAATEQLRKIINNQKKSVYAIDLKLDNQNLE